MVYDRVAAAARLPSRKQHARIFERAVFPVTQAVELGCAAAQCRDAPGRNVALLEPSAALVLHEARRRCPSLSARRPATY